VAVCCWSELNGRHKPPRSGFVVCLAYARTLRRAQPVRWNPLLASATLQRSWHEHGVVSQKKPHRHLCRSLSEIIRRCQARSFC